MFKCISWGGGNSNAVTGTKFKIEFASSRINKLQKKELMQTVHWKNTIKEYITYIANERTYMCQSQHYFGLNELWHESFDCFQN